MGRQVTRPPRVLLAAPLVPSNCYKLDEWIEAIKYQDHQLLLDVMLIDGIRLTPGWLRHLTEPGVFGNARVRIANFGDRAFTADRHRLQYAQQAAWSKFQGWSSYDHLWMCEPDVIPPPHALETLYNSEKQWAASWIRGERQVNPDSTLTTPWPWLWHSLTPISWTSEAISSTLTQLGYAELPSDFPFVCSATHLACTFIRGDVVRDHQFRLTTAGGAIGMSWQMDEVWCVPAVDCGVRIA